MWRVLWKNCYQSAINDIGYPKLNINLFLTVNNKYVYLRNECVYCILISDAIEQNGNVYGLMRRRALLAFRIESVNLDN